MFLTISVIHLRSILGREGISMLEVIAPCILISALYASECHLHLLAALLRPQGESPRELLNRRLDALEKRKPYSYQEWNHDASVVQPVVKSLN